MRFFLAAHGNRPLFHAVPEACFLHNPAAALDDVNLPVQFVIDGLLNELEGINVLQFGSGSVLLFAHSPHGYIGVASQAAFFHVAIADVQIFQDLLQPGQVIVSLRRRTNIRGRHDFYQRHAASVEVQMRVSAGIRKPLVQGFSGVFFHMDALYSNFLSGAVHGNFNVAVLRQRPVVLGDLIALREIRIKVILARPLRFRIDAAVEPDCSSGGNADGDAVQHRKRAGQSQAHRTGIHIRRLAEFCGARTEQFGVRQELGMTFQSDDGFVP